jgi:hypothetical protein
MMTLENFQVLIGLGWMLASWAGFWAIFALFGRE